MSEEEKSIAEQLAELDAEEQAETKAASDDAARTRLERNKLKKAAIEKLGGAEGKTFAIVATPLGLVVVKKCGGAQFKRLKKSEMTDGDIDEFIQASFAGIGIDKETLIKVLDDYPGAQDEILGACIRLYGVKLEMRTKK